ncbi:MAG: DUF1543 domain-containing protein [Parvularculaceae bacterium]
MGRKLFAVLIGGEVEGCHLELHDMRFVLGETIEDCYDDLKAEWWGAPESLHLDAWGSLEWADSYDILVDEPGGAESATDQKLWFFNLGGYDPAEFTELHKNMFMVGPDWRSAKNRAMEEIRGWTSPHKDFSFEVDKAIDVAAAAGNGAAITLAPSTAPKPFRFEARYVPFGRMK